MLLKRSGKIPHTLKQLRNGPPAMELKDPQAYLAAATIIVADRPEVIKHELATTLIELRKGIKSLETQSGPPTSRRT